MLEIIKPEEKLRDERFWSATISDSPVGPISILASSVGIVVIDFASKHDFTESLTNPVENSLSAPEHLDAAVNQIGAYFSGRLREFDFPIDLQGMSEFSRKVLSAAARIPFGRVWTYGSLAAAAGRSGAARAVSGVMSRNPLPIVIPCHRVVASDGSLHGYSGPGGLKTKARLLELEGHTLRNLKLNEKNWKE